jgi:2-polyprenyl-3-methyl-5-hydroxy-6-metoxy-1,4-benzoquinol methylase
VQKRIVVPERMDDPNLPSNEHEQALHGLARLNRWSFGDRLVWWLIREEAQKIAPKSLRVLDLATGSGDLPIRLARRSVRAGLPIAFHGCDISSTAIETAKQNATTQRVEVTFSRCDVLREPIPPDYDVVITSLFLHHLSEGDAVQLLAKMFLAARRMFVVNDLDRSRLNLMLVHFACRFLSRSPVVHFDGPASVRAAFSPDEIQLMANRAGLGPFSIRKQFPCRWLLTGRKPT